MTSDVSGFCDSGEGALVYVAPWSGHHVLSIASAGNLGTDYTLYSHLCVDDHGDTTATATPLQAESTVTGTVDGWGDSDLFSMDLEAGQRYELSMTGDYDYTMRAWVGTEDGRLVSSDPNLSADQNSLWLSGDQLGRVYLGVQADRTEPSAYQVKLTAIGRDDHGDGLRDATAMRLGEEVSGRWDASADVDAFVVQAVAGQRYQFQLQAADATLPFGVHLQPLEFDTLHGAFGPHTSSDGDTTLTYTWQADHDGPFALMTRSPATGRYLLSVVTVPLDDHADVPMGASPLALGATGEGRLDSPSDLDCFSLDVEAGEYYTYSVEYTGPLQLAILDNMGQSVAGMSASAREAGTVASFTVEAPSTGRITLAVHSDQPTSDDFWLSFRRADSHDIWAPIDHGRLTVDPLPVDLSGVWLPTWDNTLQP